MRCKESDPESHLVRVPLVGELVFTEHQLYDCASFALIGASKLANKGFELTLPGCSALAALWTGMAKVIDFRSEKLEGFYKTRILGESHTKQRVVVDVVAPPHAAFFFLTRIKRKQRLREGSIFFLQGR